MKNVIEYKVEHKDEVAKLAALSESYTKDADFSLANEIKILLSPQKKKKVDYKIYLYQKDKKIVGVIALNSKGKISLLITKNDASLIAFKALLSKADEYYKGKPFTHIEALVKGENTILFNELGYKSWSFIPSDSDKFNFIVKKEVSKAKTKN